MDISTLKEFICLTKYLNFSEAAFVLHVSQPTLSRHIAALEYELNTSLFTRNKSTGSLSLTYAGETFLPDAKQIVSCYNSAVKRISGVNAGYKRSLVIGYRRMYHSDDWDTIFQTFTSKYRDIQIQFAAYTDFSALYSDLNNGNVDVSISLHTSEYEKKNFNQTLFTTSALGCVINKDHPLSEKDVITFQDLDDTDILLPSKDWNLSFNEALNEKFVEHNVKPVIYQHMQNMEDADMLVKLDYGINIVPECHYIETSKHLCYRRIQGSEDKVLYYCYIKKDTINPAAKEFFKFVRLFHYPDL